MPRSVSRYSERGPNSTASEDPTDIQNSGLGPNIMIGQQLFGMTGSTTYPGIGCATCHVTSINTAPRGTPVDGGAFIVPPVLGNLTIHPYSDFLLHDVGTGDGIVQSTNISNGQPDFSTAYKIRTAPLWGLHSRNRFLHNGTAITLMQAIEAHAGEAASTIYTFNNTLTPTQRQDIIDFLSSL